ncbi:hypothetical protein JCM11957_10640 [Caminibacter profundus]
MKTEIKIYHLGENVYQIEAGKKAIVLPAKNEAEAIKKACRYFSINCNELIVTTSSKGK